jgi:hypothetical protein
MHRRSLEVAERSVSDNPRRIDRPHRSLVDRMALRRSQDVELVVGVFEVGSVVMVLVLMLGCFGSGFVGPDDGEGEDECN